MHTIIGAGSAEGSIDASSMLKPVLARGAFQIIGATTAEEFRKYLTKDPAFERRFQTIDVEEPSVEDTVKILTAPAALRGAPPCALYAGCYRGRREPLRPLHP